MGLIGIDGNFIYFIVKLMLWICFCYSCIIFYHRILVVGLRRFNELFVDFIKPRHKCLFIFLYKAKKKKKRNLYLKKYF